MSKLKVKQKQEGVFSCVRVAWTTLLLLALSSGINTEIHADGIESGRVTSSLYGKAGLLDMPNALFFDAGHISLTTMLKDPDNRVTLNFQPVPWLEGSFRYSVIEGFLPQFIDQPDIFDRSFDFKIKVLDQGTWWPAVAVGMQDFVGSGIYSGEYLVTTWQTANLNLTAGIGFGRFGTTGTLNNPLGNISSKFYERAIVTNIGETGQTLKGQYFRGPDMGVFGGIEYLTPVKGLKFIAEYSSDGYPREERLGIIDAEFPINFGATYRFSSNMEIGASLIHGNAFAMRFTMQMNPITQRDPARLDPPRFRFRNRNQDVAPDVKNFAGDSDLYRQYSALQNKMVSTAEANGKRDYITADNQWNPWDKADQGAHYASASDNDRQDANSLKPVPKTVDFDWLEIAAAPDIPATRQGYDNGNYSVANNSQSGWRFASWEDEEPGIPGARLGAAVFTTAPEVAIEPEQTAFSDTRESIEQDRTLATSTHGEIELAYYAAPNQKDREALKKALETTWSWPLTENEKLKIAGAIRSAASAQRISAIAVDFDDTRLTLYYYNGKYHREAEAIGRLLAILTQAAPPRIETFTLVATVNDLQINEITVPRGTLERIVSNQGSPQEAFNAASFQPGRTSRPRGLPLTKGKYPSLNYGLSPSIRYSLFDPDDPMRYQVSALVTATAELYDGLSLAAIYRLNLYDNFDEIVRTSNSVLPHVRSDFANYLNQAEHGLEMLMLNYAWQPAQDWYSRSFTGYFEEMYAGVGTEILYRPYGKRWAVALEVDYVQQREFNRGFELRDYNTITGFAKWYYEVPYQDLKVELNVGRYLAEDIGATFKVSRTFDNGTEIGAFATLTDVPFEEFGEGSFDKGIIIKIPFHSLSFFDTKRIYSTVIKPLTRDGGAQVWSGTPLYETTQQYSLGNIRRNWGALLE